MEKNSSSARQYADILKQRFDNLYNVYHGNLLSTLVRSHIDVRKPKIERLFVESAEIYGLNDRQITARNDKIQKAIVNNTYIAKDKYGFSSIGDYYNNAYVADVRNIHHLSPSDLTYLVSFSISPDAVYQQHKQFHERDLINDPDARMARPLQLATNYDRYAICAADMSVFMNLVEQDTLRARMKGYTKTQLMNDAAQLHNNLIYMGDSLYDFCQAQAEQVGLKPDSVQPKNSNLLHRVIELPGF